jgi:two-component system, sensor histidine kinase and response regulator
MSQNNLRTGVLWGRKLLILTISIATVLLVFFYFWILDIADTTMRKELLQQARLVSKAINIERVKNLTATESDTKTADFIRLKEQLILVRATIPEYRYIYILGRNDHGDVFFFLDGGKKIPGEIYDDVPAGYVTIFETAMADTKGPYTDKWGKFVSAGVPLVDPVNNELIAVLGIDIDARVWRQGMIHRARWLLTGLVIALSILLALIIRLLYSLRQQHLSSQALQIEKNRYKSIIEGTNAGTWEWNVQTGEAIFNEKFAEMAGYTLEELSPLSLKTWQMLAHPDDLKASNEALEKHFRGETDLYEMECRMKHKQGHWVWILDRGKVISRTKDGKPLWAFGAQTDITHRKKAEERFKESREQLKIISDNLPDILVYQIDCGVDNASRNFTYISAGVKQLHEITPSQVIQNPSLIYNQIHPEDRTSFLQWEQECIDKMFVLRFQFRVILPSGKQRWRLLISSPRRLANNHLIFDGVEIDITEQKLAEQKIIKAREIAEKNERRTQRLYDELQSSEEEIRAANEELKISSDALNNTLKELELAKEIALQNEQMYRSLLLTVPDIIVRTDLQGTITFVNDQAIKIMGNNFHGEIVGRNMLSFIAEEDVARAAEYSNLMFEGPVGVKEYKINLDGIRYIQADINGEVLRDKNGNPMGMVYIVRDITERKMMEQEKQQKELLEKKIAVAEESLKFKQNFLANMSHEIRTPLTGVLGMIDILEQTQLNENQKDYLNTIKSSGENLREIINQVLDYSKIEAGKINIKPIVFQFRSVSQNTEILFGNNVKKGVNLTSHIDPEIPEYIRADLFRISQVLNNMVSNALKFTPEGSVTIHSRLETPTNEHGQVVIKIEVKDTGIGIPESLQKKLFTPFSQIDADDARAYEGTGLGLSICKHLVELMGGKIGVRSQENSGSTFWFTFPATISSAPHRGKKERTENEIMPKLRILLAEDKVVNQKVITLMLTAMGHEVEIASNGLQALECFVPDKFDLILMDIQMPVMDGVTATRLLKEKFKTLPPIVGLSANAFEGDREKYMALGMDEYLTKPVKKDDFMSLLIKFS